MHISQLKVLAGALSHKQGVDALNTMNYMRVAQHANEDDYNQIVNTFQRM